MAGSCWILDIWDIALFDLRWSSRMQWWQVLVGSWISGTLSCRLIFNGWVVCDGGRFLLDLIWLIGMAHDTGHPLGIRDTVNNGKCTGLELHEYVERARLGAQIHEGDNLCFAHGGRLHKTEITERQRGEKANTTHKKG